MKISMIAAMGKNRTIGVKNKLPWGHSLPRDLAHFKNITDGHTVIMGRSTFESIRSSPLKNRTNIVLSKTLSVSNMKNNIKGVTVAPSLKKALEVAEKSGATEVFLIGGHRVYKEGLKCASTIYITRVEAEFEGDTFFPEWDKEKWKIEKSEDFPKDENNKYDMIFETLKKV